MRQVALWILISSITLVGPVAVTQSFGQSSVIPDACLAIHDQNGPVPNEDTRCLVATGHSCTFHLELCVNEPDGKCVPATFNPQKAIHATGHCGPVRKLQVTPAGTGMVCSPSLRDITVRTRGTHKGQCKIRAEARTSSTHAHTALRKVTLTCQPPSGTCPSTTTTTSTTSTTTTTL